MHCLFCKADTSATKSEEHIIPESLGNTEHMLPVGTVCDPCNHYLGCKVEQPLLQSPAFRQLRRGMNVPNKRGKIPAWEFANGVSMPTFRLMGRFLAKVGLEVLAFKTLEVTEWNAEIVGQPALDPLRRFARYNEGMDWPFTYRALYPVNAVFTEDDVSYELLHEFDILVTSSHEYYIVLALFGVEFVLNLGGPELDGYRIWLEDHAYASPLYSPKSMMTSEIE